jgi:hypothetical protein
MSTPKTFNAVEACRTLAKAMREEVDKVYEPLNAQKAALKVTKAIASKIDEYEYELVKMQELEKASPSDGSEATEGSKSDEEGKSKPFWKFFKKKKNKKMDKSDAELRAAIKVNDAGHPIDTATEKATRGDGAVLPDDKSIKDITKKDTGAGGQIKAGKKMKKSESAVFNLNKSLGGKPPHAAVLAPRPTLKPPGMGMALAGAGAANETTSMSGTKMNSETTLPAPVQKAGPRLGGKDPASKMMTGHAMDASYRAEQKNKLMPTTQQSTKPAAPPMATQLAPSGQSSQVSRQQGFEDFMPKGKWNKAEVMKNLDDMNKTLPPPPNARSFQGPGINIGAAQTPKGSPVRPAHKSPVFAHKQKAAKALEMNDKMAKAELCKGCGKSHSKSDKC